MISAGGATTAGPSAEPPGTSHRRAITPLDRRVAIEHILEVPPVQMAIVPGFESAVFPYTTVYSVRS